MADTAGAHRRTRAAVPARLPWPVVPRPEERRAVAVVVEHGWNVALVGAPGLGKSVLAGRVIDRVVAAESDGRTVVVDARASEHELRAAAEQASAADGTAARVLLRVDDADRLDQIAARYVAWLVREHGARIVLTCRDFTTLAEPLRALWQDDLLERIDLAPLDLRDTERLLRLALDAPLESSSVERVHRATQGNPLYLREVVRSALASGALERTASGWYWRGRITASSSLADMYRSELAQLPGDLRDVVDIVALADPIPLPRLLGLVADGDVDRVTSLGLVTVDVEPGSNAVPMVRPSHPLVGEVVRSLVPVARRTKLFARTNAFRDEPSESVPPAARLRSTLWALECGVVPPAAHLLDAASVASRLQEYESAVSLASAVLADTRADAATTIAAHSIRAVATTFDVGREQARDDAEHAWQLARVAAGAIDDALVVEAAEILANLRQFHDDDVDAAVAIVDEAVRLVGDAARERLRVLRLAHLGWGGRFREVLAETDRAGVLDGIVPFWFLAVAPCSVIALALAGRVPEALRLGRAALATAAAHIEDAPWSVGELMSVVHQVQMWQGDISGLTVTVDVRRSSPFFKYDFTLELLAAGNLAVAERRWEDAKGAFRAACERFAVMDHGGFAAYPWIRLSLAHAMLGENAEAAAALDRGLATPLRGMRITAEELPSTIVVTEYLLGRPLALERAIGIAERSERNEAWLPAMFGRMLQLRIESDRGGDTAEITARIKDVARRVETPVAEAYLTYVAASERRDEAGKRAAATQMADLGFAIAQLHSTRREPLTRREHEIAVLAAEGLSNRQIADHLGRSVRTIDAHMSRIFAKWDLHARSELAHLF